MIENHDENHANETLNLATQVQNYPLVDISLSGVNDIY